MPSVPNALLFLKALFFLPYVVLTGMFMGRVKSKKNQHYKSIFTMFIKYNTFEPIYLIIVELNLESNLYHQLTGPFPKIS